MRGNVPEHSINFKRICHTERSEIFQTVLVKVNPSPQSSPQGEEEKVLISHTARSFTRLNFVLSVQQVSPRRGYISIQSLRTNVKQSSLFMLSAWQRRPTICLSMVYPSEWRNRNDLISMFPIALIQLIDFFPPRRY